MFKALLRGMLITAMILYGVSNTLRAADMPPLDPNDPRVADRKTMRDILVATEQAFNALDVEAVLRVLAKDVVVVWQDGHTSTSHDDIRQHYTRTFQGTAGILKSLRMQATVSGPARFHGEDHAVVYGTTQENYTLIGGVQIPIQGLWTATMTRRAGAWEAVALHLSTNPFDNAVLHKARQMGWLLGTLGLVLGVAIGWLSPKLWRRFRRQV